MRDPFGQEAAMNKALVAGIGFLIGYWLLLEKWGLL